MKNLNASNQALCILEEFSLQLKRGEYGLMCKESQSNRG